MSALLEWLSFFSVFLFWKIFFEREFQGYNQQIQDAHYSYGSGIARLLFLGKLRGKKKKQKELRYWGWNG